MGEEDFIAAISAFGGTYAPINYALCQGQTIAINQYQALYAQIGTIYQWSGNSQTFTLPNLVSGMPVGAGTQQMPGAVQLGAQGQSAHFALSNGMPAAMSAGDTPTVPSITASATLGVNYVICLIGIWPSRP